MGAFPPIYKVGRCRAMGLPARVPCCRCMKRLEAQGAARPLPSPRPSH